MKAEELMIGDWVLYGKKPVRVLQLSEGNDYKDIHPIPLTPEILEKNGFCRFWDEDVMLMTRDDVDLEVGNNYKTFEDGRVYLKGIKMYYVHQLQNALRLCGIDKTIEL